MPLLRRPLTPLTPVTVPDPLKGGPPLPIPDDADDDANELLVDIPAAGIRLVVAAVPRTEEEAPRPRTEPRLVPVRQGTGQFSRLCLC